MIGCLRNALVLILFLAIAAVAWIWGPELLRTYTASRGGSSADGPTPSRELAEATLDRLEAFRAGEAGEQLLLGEAELSSLVLYALPGVLPPGVDEPQVAIKDGRLHFSARVALEAFPDLPSLEEVLQVLPDTVLVELQGILTPFDRSRAALRVAHMEAARIPLPGRMIPEVLRGLGRRTLPNLPPDALAVPLPEGISAVYLLQDSLVLSSDR